MYQFMRIARDLCLAIWQCPRCHTNNTDTSIHCRICGDL